MNTESVPLHEMLEKIFHEPNRLAIMSALAAAEKRRLTFTELKEACRITDGNLNSHLSVLEGAGAVRVHKEFADRKPRTTVALTAAGLERFSEYLDALGRVLQEARAALPAAARRTAPAGHAVPA